MLWKHSRKVKWAVDATLVAATVFLAFLQRYETGPETWGRHALVYLLFVLPMWWAVSINGRLASQSWGHVGIKDLKRLAATSAIYALAGFFLASVLQTKGYNIPRSIPLLAAVFAFLSQGAARLVIRSWAERTGGRGAGFHRILIVGTSERALMFVRQLQEAAPDERPKAVGFLDDNPTRQGLSFLGVKVLGRSQDAASIVEEYQVDEVVMTEFNPDSPSTQRVQIVCDDANIRCRYLGSVTELLYGRLHHGRNETWGLRELLRREPIKMDDAAIRATIEGKTILVTGAGGSIGSEISRQVAAMQPSKLLLLGIEENGVFDIENELHASFPQLNLIPTVADIRSKDRLKQVFQEHSPQVVFHAAAHKHVPLMEAQPCEAILNNVGGTQNLLENALATDVERFVLVSTDKAVRPANVMGATKRVTERLLLAAAARAPHRDYVAVRFGNVLGSRGSVLPTWERQISNGGPVTITHPDMTRFFMLIPEAVQLVLQAGQFGGSGTIYVLDMGTPVRIGDLAEDLIRHHGMVPHKDIALEFTGLRPGEKMYEELIINRDRQAESPHTLIFVEPKSDFPPMAKSLEALLDAASRGNDAKAREVLAQLSGLDAIPK